MVNAAANPNDQTAAANSLCATGSANGINCAVVMQPGKHDWPFAVARVRRRAAVAGRPARHSRRPVVPLPTPAARHRLRAASR